MDCVKINGICYDVIVVSISEDFNILYSENTGRTLSQGARMVLDPLGTFYGHKVTFARRNGKESEYDNLFTELSKPASDGIRLEIVHNQNTIEYDAYVSKGDRSLLRVDPITEKVYWDKFTVNFIPMEAQLVSG